MQFIGYYTKRGSFAVASVEYELLSTVNLQKVIYNSQASVVTGIIQLYCL